MLTVSQEFSPALRALRENPVPGLRQIQVDETDECVTLTGTVHSWYLKQLAQEAVLPVLQGRDLSNQILVVRVEAIQSGRTTIRV